MTKKPQRVRSYLAEERSREALQAREQAEKQKALNRARSTQRSVAFTAHDGCEVTATPGGDVFYNAADWW